jgi:hypothetical protein
LSYQEYQMSEIAYGRINDFLHDYLSEFNLYIQEGSGGYYIASRKENSINGGAFVDRLAQIVEDGDSFNLSMRDIKTGQWEEYTVHTTLDEALSALSARLKDGSSNYAGGGPDQKAITEISFNCWSCGDSLLKINSGGSPLYLDWADGLDNIEISCPKCKKLMLFNLNNEKDRGSILSSETNVSPISQSKVSAFAAVYNNGPYNHQGKKQIRIDFYDLLWRLKDHTNTYSHYLNLLTGEIERIDSNSYGRPRDEIFKFAKYPWRKIPPISSREAYSVMEEFINQVESGEIKAQLENAILGPKPFKSFKMVVQEFPELNELWVKSENDFYLNKSREWLDSISIDYEMMV